MAIDIVDFPIKNSDFPVSYVSHYQRLNTKNHVYEKDDFVIATGRATSPHEVCLGQSINLCFLKNHLFGDGSKPWYLVNLKIAGFYGRSSH